MKIKCPICQSDDVKQVAVQKNIPFTNLKQEMPIFSLSICKKCSFIFQESAYSKKYNEQIEKVYENYFLNHSFKFPRKDKTNLDSLNFILPFVKENDSILEIGSARGDFLYLIKEKKPSINILGIEPSLDKAYVPTINSMFNEKLFVNTFDIIILRHTLEHIKYPREFIKKLKKVMHKDTLLYIEVPNTQKNLEFLTEDFEPDHVNYFSLYTLSTLFKKYEIVEHDTSSFLRVIFKKSKKNNYIDTPKDDIEHKIKTIFENKYHFLKNIKKEKRKIVFYGVSHYYNFLVYQISKIRTLDNCFFYDDNFDDDIESTFKLKRVSDLDGTVVVTCSNVPYVQDKMQNNLSNMNCEIIKPWRKIE